ncbi:MAG: hypothetical protein LBR61_09790 [Synergistaceae bacterium]|nr:hypothetical protein [Synergistaceae bacterium]
MIRKLLLRVCLFVVIFGGLGVTLIIWGPLLPLVLQYGIDHYGGAAVPALTVDRVSGNLAGGITLEGIELVSGDAVLLQAGRLGARLSWEDLRRGVPWLSDLEMSGLRTTLENLNLLSAHYGGGEKKENSSPLELRPIRVELRDLALSAGSRSFRLDEALLTPEGRLTLSADAAGLPLRGEGSLVFSPLEARSFTLSAGTGQASLEGRLQPPFDLRGEFRSLKLEEFLSAFLRNEEGKEEGKTEEKIKGKGNFDGNFSLQGEGESLTGRGRIGLTRGEVEGIAVSAEIPWNYGEGQLFVPWAEIKSLSADVALGVSADLRPVPQSDRFFVRGTARNISMKKINDAFSSKLDLKPRFDGEGGMVDFWVSGDRTGSTAGKAFVRVPDFRVDDRQLVKGLRTEVFLSPGLRVFIRGSGEVFGAQLTTSGEPLGENGRLHPKMTLSLEGMDTALLAAALPGAASLAPSGKASLTLNIDDRRIMGALSSPKLTAGGITLTDLSAAVHFDEKQVIFLDELKGKLGKAPLNLSGTASLKTGALWFDGLISGLDPASLPPLKGSVSGLCDVSATVRGTLSSPRAEAVISSREVRVGDFPIRRVKLAGSYAGSRVTIPETTLELPGGAAVFQGFVDLPKRSEPVLNLSGSLKGLDLSKMFPADGASPGGRVSASLNVSGPVSAAALKAVLQSDRIAVASMDVRDLYLDFAGTTRNVAVQTVRAKIDGGSLEGRGKVTFDRRGDMDVMMKVKNLEVRSLLAKFGLDAGVGGNLDGTLRLWGTPRRPNVTLDVLAPLTVNETLVDRLSLTVSAPERGRFDLGIRGDLGSARLDLKGRLQRNKGGWDYEVESAPLDLDGLVSAKMPSMKGTLKGTANVKVTGRLNGRRSGKAGAEPVNLAVMIPSLSAAGVTVKNILLPLRYLGNQATLRNGTASLFGGKITLSGDVMLKEQDWKMAAAVRGLDFGEAAAPFLKEGKVVGSADIHVSANGNFGTLMTAFAQGDFKSGGGHISDLPVLALVTEDKRLPFEEIRGSFFWDGRDLQLNPGTQVTAPPGAPLYRYFAFSGPLGIPGKGLGLICQGRFDIQALNKLLGAMKSAFQLMTGSLAGGSGGGLGTSLIRGVVAKAIGYTERDFEDVTFQLKGSWKELQLLNLTISKSLETYLPLNQLNSDAEREKDTERKFQFSLTIPAGPGGAEDEEGDTENQIKKQFLDNLLNQIY